MLKGTFKVIYSMDTNLPRLGSKMASRRSGPQEPRLGLSALPPTSACPEAGAGVLDQESRTTCGLRAFPPPLPTPVTPHLLL